MIIDHKHPTYAKARRRLGRHKYNGAYYYSCEIVDNIIPNVITDRNWMTVVAGDEMVDHSIIFVHDNLNTENTYGRYAKLKDAIFVVGLPCMVDRVSKLGRTVYLPLNVDTKYVHKFKQPKTKKLASIGRKAATRIERGYSIDPSADLINLLPRPDLLEAMAKYEQVYAIGRTAIEAKVLGCEVLPFHPDFPDPELWKVVDNIEAARTLQDLLDEIDG